MSSELKYKGAQDRTIYAIIYNPAGNGAWNGTTFETFDPDNRDSYKVTMSDYTSEGLYVGDFPTAWTVAGRYVYVVYDAANDQGKALGAVPWDGSAEYSVGSIDNQELILSKLDELLAGEVTGDGTTLVNHNYPTTDNLRYTTVDGIAVDNASIKIYLTEDYTAGNFNNSYLVGSSRTGSDGRWEHAVLLDPGAYTIIFVVPELYGPDAKTITVS